MTPLALHHALHTDAPTSPRFVLVVMALHADHRSRCALSLRELGDMTGLSPQSVSVALKRLQDAGHVTLTHKGAGSQSSVYAITTPDAAPAPAQPVQLVEPVGAPAPEITTPAPNPAPTTETPPSDIDPLSSSHVRAVIEAARVDTSGQAALYWSRHDHVRDLRAILDRTGLTVADICDRLRAAPPAGPVRRLTALPIPTLEERT